MTPPAPLESIYEALGVQGDGLLLPPELGAFYGSLQFPPHPGKPLVIGNFVTTLDGVVSLNVPGHAGGGDISGFNQHDRMVMGLLRAIADAVVVGAGTLRAVPQHVWTAEYIYPPLTEAYHALRTSLGKSAPPLNVIVTARGELDLGLRVFQSGEVPVLIVTTAQGARKVRQICGPRPLQIAAVGNNGTLSAHAILDRVGRVCNGDVVLVEGGPQLIGDFFAEQCLDELFLTLAPQIAGRDGATNRPGLVAGKHFAPDRPIWGKLLGVKRGGSHLFLRYSFESRRE